MVTRSRPEFKRPIPSYFLIDLFSLLWLLCIYLIEKFL